MLDGPLSARLRHQLAGTLKRFSGLLARAAAELESPLDSPKASASVMASSPSKEENSGRLKSSRWRSAPYKPISESMGSDPAGEPRNSGRTPLFLSKEMPEERKYCHALIQRITWELLCTSTAMKHSAIEECSKDELRMRLLAAFLYGPPHSSLLFSVDGDETEDRHACASRSLGTPVPPAPSAGSTSSHRSTSAWAALLALRLSALEAMESVAHPMEEKIGWREAGLLPLATSSSFFSSINAPFTQHRLESFDSPRRCQLEALLTNWLLSALHCPSRFMWGGDTLRDQFLQDGTAAEVWAANRPSTAVTDMLWATVNCPSVQPSSSNSATPQSLFAFQRSAERGSHWLSDTAAAARLPILSGAASTRKVGKNEPLEAQSASLSFTDLIRQRRSSVSGGFGWESDGQTRSTTTPVPTDSHRMAPSNEAVASTSRAPRSSITLHKRSPSANTGGAVLHQSDLHSYVAAFAVAHAQSMARCLSERLVANPDQRATQRQRLVFYANAQAVHPDALFAARLVGYEHIRLVPSASQPQTDNMGLDVAVWCEMVAEDLAAGLLPSVLCASVLHGPLAVLDPVDELSLFCAQSGIWCHLVLDPVAVSALALESSSRRAEATPAVVAPLLRHFHTSLSHALDFVDSFQASLQSGPFSSFMALAMGSADALLPSGGLSLLAMSDARKLSYTASQHWRRSALEGIGTTGISVMEAFEAERQHATHSPSPPRTEIEAAGPRTATLALQPLTYSRLRAISTAVCLQQHHDFPSQDLCVPGESSGWSRAHLEVLAALHSKILQDGRLEVRRQSLLAGRLVCRWRLMADEATGRLCAALQYGSLYENKPLPPSKAVKCDGADSFCRIRLQSSLVSIQRRYWLCVAVTLCASDGKEGCKDRWPGCQTEALAEQVWRLLESAIHRVHQEAPAVEMIQPNSM